VLWAKSTEGIGGGVYAGILSIATDINGNVLVTGSYNEPGLVFGKDTLMKLNNNGDNNIFLAKYDASGNVLWARCAKTINPNLRFVAVGNGVVTDSSGNIYVMGATTNYKNPYIIFGKDTLLNDSSGNTCIFIVKYDSSGNVVWAKNGYGTGALAPIGLAIDNSDNLYITGYFEGFSVIFGSDTINPGLGNEDVFLAKYDANGNGLWVKSFGGNDGAHPISIAIDKSRNIYITGSCGFDTLVFGSDTLFGSQSGDIFLVKYDGNGNPIWIKGAGGPGNYSTQGCGVATASNGNIFLTGNIGEPYVKFGSDTIFTKGYVDIFLAEYAPNSNLIWVKNVGCPTSNYNSGNACTTDLYDDVYITGTFGSDTLDFGPDTLRCHYSSVFLAKSTEGTVSINELKVESEKLKVYPNPASTSFTILLPEAVPVWLNLYNELGQRVITNYELKITASTINVSSLPEGVYFYRVIAEDGSLIGEGKEVIQR
jgi:hypothetical protein